MKKPFSNFLYVLLFSPLLAYIYTVTLKLPKTLNHFYVLLFFVTGIIFILTKENLKYPRYIWFLFIYSTYRLVWVQITGSFNNPLTLIYYSVLNYSILFIILIIHNTYFTDKFIKNSVLIIKISVVLAAVVSIIQVFDLDFLNAWKYMGKEMEGTIYTFRRASLFGFVDSNELGLSYIPLASVLTGSLLLKKSKTNIIFTILVGLTALLSNGRYVMVGFLILTIQYFVYYQVKFKGLLRYTFYIAIAGLILFYSLRFFGYNYSDWFEKRIFAEGDITESTRYEAFYTFAHFFPKNIIWGTGVHLTEEIKEASARIHSSQIHVGYLSHLVSYGIFGSFFLWGFWLMLAKKLYNTAKKTKYWGSFFAFLIYFWAQATLVNYSIFFTGLIFALVFDKYHSDRYKYNLKTLNY